MRNVINITSGNGLSLVQVPLELMQGPSETMKMLSNGNIIHITGPLWGESTSHWWIPLTKAIDAERWCFSLICAWTNGWANSWNDADLKCHRAHYYVTVMRLQSQFDKKLKKIYWKIIHVNCRPFFRLQCVKRCFNLMGRSNDHRCMLFYGHEWIGLGMLLFVTERSDHKMEVIQWTRETQRLVSISMTLEKKISRKSHFQMISNAFVLGFV